MILRVYSLAQGDGLSEAAARQSSYRLDIAHFRGAIYDCNMEKLVSQDRDTIAAVAPSVKSAAVLSGLLPKSEMESVFSLLQSGKPFALRLDQPLDSGEDIDVFQVDVRYREAQLAPHVIGYCDGSGTGISGIELAYDDWLSADQGEISVLYKVDAINRVLAGEQREVTDTSALKNRGVVLTLDSGLQKLAEEVAKKHMEKGAVIINDVATGEIRALVSLPDFSPLALADVLDDEDAPLINRAFSSYNIGSVFKLVSAAAALEYGLSPEITYECTGGIEVDGTTFHCYNSKAHGAMDMHEAIAQSCNAYFIHLMQMVPPERFIETAKAFGFGTATEFAPGMSSSAGILTELSAIRNSKALANLSFGQGDLMSTPVQVAALVNAIACGGEYRPLSLVKGLVDEEGNFTEQNEPVPARRVISERTAQLLEEYMISSVEYGTSVWGKPEHGQAAAKTATAETGLKVDDRRVVQAWFSGYYPVGNPLYTITILVEDGDGGGTSCGPIFRDITEAIYQHELLPPSERAKGGY